MNDLISRQAAIDALENTKTAISENGERYIAKQNAIMRIDALPSAQPRTGKWKNIVDGIEYTWGTCDTCGAHIPMPYKYYEYCPHCGTKNEVKHG